MKSLVIILSTAAILTIAIAASGFAFDGAVVLSICAASSLVGMFVSDYSRAPRYEPDPVETPARQDECTGASKSGVEFATFTTCDPFDATVG